MRKLDNRYALDMEVIEEAVVKVHHISRYIHISMDNEAMIMRNKALHINEYLYFKI